MENDEQIYGVAGDEITDFELVSDDASGALSGPRFDGFVTGSGKLNGEANLLKMSNPTSGVWELHELILSSDSTFVVGDNSVTANVDFFQLDLYEPVEGLSGTALEFTVPRSTAVFSATGHVAGIPYAVFVTNTTSITIERASLTSDWEFDTFVVHFRDENGEDWDLSVEAEDWQ